MTIKKYHPLNGILQQSSKNGQEREICLQDAPQKSVDMGLKLEKNMGGWVFFFHFRSAHPRHFLGQVPPGEMV